LAAARLAALAGMKTSSAALSSSPQNAAAFEAPMRVVLNPDLKDIARLQPPGVPPSPPPTAGTSVGSALVGPQTTFAPLTREQQLRQALAEGQRETASIERGNQLLDLGIAGAKGVVAAGGMAARMAGGVAAAPLGPGAAVAASNAAGIAYSVVTAAPDVILGNKSLSQAATDAGAHIIVDTVTGAVGGGLGASPLEKTIVGTATKELIQPKVDQMYRSAADWFYEYRSMEVPTAR
jgi:hypothetical protein